MGSRREDHFGFDEERLIDFGLLEVGGIPLLLIGSIHNHALLATRWSFGLLLALRQCVDKIVFEHLVCVGAIRVMGQLDNLWVDALFVRLLDNDWGFNRWLCFKDEGTRECVQVM